jgi:molecular chaperone GrpE
MNESGVEEMKDEEVIEETVKAEDEATVEEIAEATEIQSEDESFKDKFYYLAAEMENMKRRFSKEKESLLKYGSEKILGGLVDVIDNLDRTLDAISTDEEEKIKNIFTGIDMVKGQFISVLKNSGLEEVKALGETFDPKVHEALAQRPEEGKEDQEIVEVFQKGYTLNGRLLRAAKVVIVKN